MEDKCLRHLLEKGQHCSNLDHLVEVEVEGVELLQLRWLLTLTTAAYESQGVQLEASSQECVKAHSMEEMM